MSDSKFSLGFSFSFFFFSSSFFFAAALSDTSLLLQPPQPVTSNNEETNRGNMQQRNQKPVIYPSVLPSAIVQTMLIRNRKRCATVSTARSKSQIPQRNVRSNFNKLKPRGVAASRIIYRRTMEPCHATPRLAGEAVREKRLSFPRERYAVSMNPGSASLPQLTHFVLKLKHSYPSNQFSAENNSSAFSQASSSSWARTETRYFD